MKLRPYLVEQLAVMVVGDHEAFPYRSSWYITKFFEKGGFPFKHDGSTRKWWVNERLLELNSSPSSKFDLPSDELTRVIVELLDSDEFDRAKMPREPAVDALNELLKKQGLNVQLDQQGICYLRSTSNGVMSSTMINAAPLSQEEIEQRETVKRFLETATEDEFTQQLLVPLLQRLGFRRVSPTGHVEKTLEYGKDLWTKFQLPTGHWLYFGAQVKREKLDAKGGSGDSNTATVLDQVRMALEHPIFDPETGRKVLVDHMFVISAGEITRAARNWLVEKLDQSQRRQIIFMDREEFLDHAARILLDLRFEESRGIDEFDPIPF